MTPTQPATATDLDKLAAETATQLVYLPHTDSSDRPVSMWEHVRGTIRQALATATSPLEQQLAALKAEYEYLWRDIEAGFEIEPRSFFEKEAPTNGFKYPLLMALHYIWKRDPKVSDLEQRVRELEQQLESERAESQRLRCEMRRAVDAGDEAAVILHNDPTYRWTFGEGCGEVVELAKKRMAELAAANAERDEHRRLWDESTKREAKTFAENAQLREKLAAAERDVEQWQSAFSLFGFPDPDMKPADVARRIEVAEKQRDELLLKVAQLEGNQPEGFAKMFAIKARQDRLEARDGDTVWRQLECDRCKKQMVYDNGDERDLTMMDVEAVKCWNCGAIKVFDSRMKDETACELAEETFEPPHSMYKRLQAAEQRAAQAEQALKQENIDWAETDEFIREQARKILGAEYVNGDTFAVPPVEDLVEKIVERAEQLQRERDEAVAKGDDWKRLYEAAANETADELIGQREQLQQQLIAARQQVERLCQKWRAFKATVETGNHINPWGPVQFKSMDDEAALAASEEKP